MKIHSKYRDEKGVTLSANSRGLCLSRVLTVWCLLSLHGVCGHMTVSNIGLQSYAVTDSLGNSIPAGAGTVAIGTFDVDPPAECGIPTALAEFMQFSWSSSVGFGGVDGLFWADVSGALSDGDAFVGKNVFVLIGNGPTLWRSSSLLIYKHRAIFRADPAIMDLISLSPENLDGELMEIV